jgi:DNA-binding NtrC family response regulator
VTIVRDIPASAARPLGALVRVLGDRSIPAAGFRLSHGKCVVGSAPGCDVVVAQPELVAEGVAVRDLGSRNGTFYLGQRVERMVLGLGGQIEIGATTLIIDADADSLQSGELYAGDTFRGMVGGSAVMRRLFATLARLDGSLVSVLVRGESGVGKELVARAIHAGSSVSSGPLSVVNCGAIPRDLAASELFGHRRGAFTGAVDHHRGAFESADGGTLFLDEIGELPLEVQPMLLRVLETGEVRALGSEQSRQVRVRLICATHRDLQEEVAAGRFREDLYYRLAVVTLEVPPLRDRPEDVAPLARRFAVAAGLQELPSQVMERLQAQPWRGNARELVTDHARALRLGASEELLARRAQLGPVLELLSRFVRRGAAAYCRVGRAGIGSRSHQEHYDRREGESPRGRRHHARLTAPCTTCARGRARCLLD